METMDYQKQATDFLEKHGITFTAEYLRTGKHFDSDESDRDIYTLTLKRGSRSLSVEFGQSINDSGIKIIASNGQPHRNGHKIFSHSEWKSNKGVFDIHKAKLWFNTRYFMLSANEKLIFPKAPTAYDLLTCLTRYPVGEFEDFCSEFGYDTDSRKAKKTYKAVLKEWIQVNNLFSSSEIEELQEIQ